MSTELSGRVFEWLLASWAGHRDHPEDLFPALKDANTNQLDKELSVAIRNASQFEESLHQA